MIVPSRGLVFLASCTMGVSTHDGQTAFTRTSDFKANASTAAELISRCYTALIQVSKRIVLTGRSSNSNDSMLSRNIGGHAGCGDQGVGGPNQDDRALPQATLTISSRIFERLLLGHDSQDCADEQQGALDAHIVHLRDDIHIDGMCERSVVLKVNLQ